MTDFDRVLKRLSAKRWVELRQLWLEHIPEIEPAGAGPAELLEENVDLQSEMRRTSSATEHRFEPEVHPAAQVFHEAVFASHRAVRVACAAQRQVDDGLPTWSISTAHQASMFALRSLLGLCGISYIEAEGVQCLVDVFPAGKKGMRGRGSVIRVSRREVQLLRVRKMEQRHWWLVLQRVLRTSSESFRCWRPFGTELASCDVRVLSRERNVLHYRGKWFLGDLYKEDGKDGFGRIAGGEVPDIVDRFVTEGRWDGSLLLNRLLVTNAIAMLRDLGGLSHRVQGEVDIIDRTLGRFGTHVVIP